MNGQEEHRPPGQIILIYESGQEKTLFAYEWQACLAADQYGQEVLAGNIAAFINFKARYGIAHIRYPKGEHMIGITRFALRRWQPEFAGTRIVGLTADELVELANKTLAQGGKFAEGYAPFCKHLFIRNPSSTRAGVAEITDANRHMLCSGYEARRPEELPVLTRWFEGLDAPRAIWLDIILYSREQLEEEDKDEPESERDVPNAPWAIVAVNGGPLPEETPMPPITMMRNALGAAEGGSGVPLDREKYLASVQFWEKHALVR